MVGKKEIDDVMRKVKSWLIEDGLYKDKLIDDNADYHYITVFPAESQQIVDVIHPKQLTDMIVIGSGISLSDEHYKALKSTPKPEKDKFLWDLRYQLLFRDSEFYMLPSAEDLREFRFARPLYFDGLTKNAFMEALRENFKCKLFVIWKIDQFLGVSYPSSLGKIYG